jgi:hypothetical protein
MRNGRRYIKPSGVEFRSIVKQILVDAQAEIIDTPCALKSLILVGKDKRRRDNDNSFKCLFDAIMNAGFLVDDSLIYQYKNVDKSLGGNVLHDLDKKGFCLVEFEKIEGATGGFVGVRASDFEIDSKLI